MQPKIPKTGKNQRAGKARLALAVTFACLAVPAVALAAQTVSYQGPSRSVLTVAGDDTADNVTLGVAEGGQRIAIDGFIPGGPPTACTGNKSAIACQAAGVSDVLVDVAGSGDKVTVASALPVPLTVRLGGGNDKLIGNGEIDVCYQQGGARNRCIGAGGDDKCYGGSGRNDCLGGPGDDFCSVKGDNDGCLSMGAGDDTCRMGAGSDKCYGEGGNDRLIGGRGADRLVGGPGRDYCDSGGGRDGVSSCESGPG